MKGIGSMGPAELSASLNANLIANTQLAGQRLNITGENLTGGLGVIQNTSIQHTIMAATAATLQADDAQAAMGLNTAVRTPLADKA